MKKLINILMALLLVGVIYSCDKVNANQSSVLGANFSDKKASILESYKIGEAVDDFSLKGIDGKMHSMSDYPNAEGYIVVFTCNSCPYSQMYEERIKAISAKYTNDGWPLIAINPNDPEVQPKDSYAKMKSYAAQKDFNFPYLVDEGQKVYPKWGAARTPHVFIVEHTNKGNILRYIGAVDDNARDESKVKVNYVDNTIAAIRSGETIDPDFTKAIGCSIKTK